MTPSTAFGARTTARRHRARGRASSRGGIRWDRVARIMLLVVLAAIVVSYAGPATKYFEAWKLARETRTEVRDLRIDNARLRESTRRLHDPGQIELEARRIGMARPGERVYVVKRLPKE